MERYTAEDFDADLYESLQVQDFSDLHGDSAATVWQSIHGGRRSLLGETQAINTAEMSADFTIVTRNKKGAPNRHGNMVAIAGSDHGRGMLIDEWQRNPIVLFDHNAPIGKAESPNGDVRIKLEKWKATSTVWFSQTNALAKDVFGLVAEKIVRMASIGFAPTRGILMKELKREELPEGVEDLDHRTRWRGWDFVESILMEWSVVGIGADADALRQAWDHRTLGGEKWTPHPAILPFVQQTAAKVRPYTVGLNLAAGESAIVLRQSSGQSLVQALIGRIEQEGDDAVAAAIEWAEKHDPITVEDVAEEVQSVETDVDRDSGSPTNAAHDELELLAQSLKPSEVHHNQTNELQGLAELLTGTVETAFSDLRNDQEALAKRLDQLSGTAA